MQKFNAYTFTMIKSGLKNRLFNFIIGLKCLFIQLTTGRESVFLKPTSTFIGDGYATTHHIGFLDDQQFVNAFDKAFDDIPDNPGKQAKLDIAWRAHICTWAANQAMALEGDFIECGVWYGILSRTICNYVDFSRHDGTFYLVDTWGKMPGSHTSSDYQDDIFSVVQKRFSDVDNVQLIRGPVPDVLTQITSSKVAFLAIDMNGSVPERAALEYFYDKIVPGGVIYFDDYGWGFPELRATVEDFFMDKPETLLHFPSGNSIVVKL